MLLGGDERGRTQGGNNNAYCQDNEVSWVDWRLDEAGRELLEFTRKLIQIRYAHPALHRRKFFQGRSIHGRQVQDVEWFRPDGAEMSDEEWSEALGRCFGIRLNGQAMDEWDERGNHIHDDILLLLLNAGPDDVPFALPGAAGDPPWEALIDTAAPDGEQLPSLLPGEEYPLEARSMALLRQACSTN
jgi:glycogen operon protein